MGIQRVPNLLRWTVLACCLPYPGDPKSAIDCFFLFGISLHPGVTGSAPHWKFRGCRVHSFPSPQELLRPASWLALLSRTFTFELARRGRPQSASNMTTWINSQFPRPDFHRQVQRHYGLQDTGFPGLTHHNSESGLAGKPCLLVKSKLLDHIVATFR